MSILPSISFLLPSLASVVFALESNSLFAFLSLLWASLREMEKNFLILSSLVLKAHYLRIRVVPHSCKLAQAEFSANVSYVVNHRSWEFWILFWALLDKISLSFIIWPNLCKFSQEHWEAHMIQRPFPSKLDLGTWERYAWKKTYTHISLPKLLNVSKKYYQSCFQKWLDCVADFFHSHWEWRQQ